MAYITNKNPLTFGGTLSPWALSLSNWGLQKLIESRAHVPFVSLHGNGTVCLIVPTIAAERVSACVYYGLKRAALSPSRLVSIDVEEMTGKHWRKFSRAFVQFEVGFFGQLVGIDHDATVRSANELSRDAHRRTPQLDEIDSALSTSLGLMASMRSNENQELIYAIRH